MIQRTYVHRVKLIGDAQESILRLQDIAHKSAVKHRQDAIDYPAFIVSVGNLLESDLTTTWAQLFPTGELYSQKEAGFGVRARLKLKKIIADDIQLHTNERPLILVMIAINNSLGVFIPAFVREYKVQTEETVDAYLADALNQMLGVIRNAIINFRNKLLIDLNSDIDKSISNSSVLAGKIRNFIDVTVSNDAAFLSVPGGDINGTAVIRGIEQQITALINAFSQKPRTSFAKIVTACDDLILNINKPESL